MAIKLPKSPDSQELVYDLYEIKTIDRQSNEKNYKKSNEFDDIFAYKFYSKQVKSKQDEKINAFETTFKIKNIRNLGRNKENVLFKVKLEDIEKEELLKKLKDSKKLLKRDQQGFIPSAVYPRYLTSSNNFYYNNEHSKNHLAAPSFLLPVNGLVNSKLTKLYTQSQQQQIHRSIKRLNDQPLKLSSQLLLPSPLSTISAFQWVALNNKKKKFQLPWNKNHQRHPYIKPKYNDLLNVKSKNLLEQSLLGQNQQITLKKAIKSNLRTSASKNFKSKTKKITLQGDSDLFTNLGNVPNKLIRNGFISPTKTKLSIDELQLGSSDKSKTVKSQTKTNGNSNDYKIINKNYRIRHISDKIEKEQNNSKRLINANKDLSIISELSLSSSSSLGDFSEFSNFRSALIYSNIYNKNLKPYNIKNKQHYSYEQQLQEQTLPSNLDQVSVKSLEDSSKIFLQFSSILITITFTGLIFIFILIFYLIKGLTSNSKINFNRKSQTQKIQEVTNGKNYELKLNFETLLKKENKKFTSKKNNMINDTIEITNNTNKSYSKYNIYNIKTNKTTDMKNESKNKIFNLKVKLQDNLKVNSIIRNSNEDYLNKKLKNIETMNRSIDKSLENRAPEYKTNKNHKQKLTKISDSNVKEECSKWRNYSRRKSDSHSNIDSLQDNIKYKLTRRYSDNNQLQELEETTHAKPTLTKDNDNKIKFENTNKNIINKKHLNPILNKSISVGNNYNQKNFYLKNRKKIQKTPPGPHSKASIIYCKSVKLFSSLFSPNSIKKKEEQRQQQEINKFRRYSLPLSTQNMKKRFSTVEFFEKIKFKRNFTSIPNLSGSRNVQIQNFGTQFSFLNLNSSKTYQELPYSVSKFSLTFKNQSLKCNQTKKSNSMPNIKVYDKYENSEITFIDILENDRIFKNHDSNLPCSTPSFNSIKLNHLNNEYDLTSLSNSFSNSSKFLRIQHEFSASSTIPLADLQLVYLQSTPEFSHEQNYSKYKHNILDTSFRKTRFKNHSEINDHCHQEFSKSHDYDNKETILNLNHKNTKQQFTNKTNRNFIKTETSKPNNESQNIVTLTGNKIVLTRMIQNGKFKNILNSNNEGIDNSNQFKNTSTGDNLFKNCSSSNIFATARDVKQYKITEENLKSKFYSTNCNLVNLFCDANQAVEIFNEKHSKLHNKASNNKNNNSNCNYDKKNNRNIRNNEQINNQSIQNNVTSQQNLERENLNKENQISLQTGAITKNKIDCCVNQNKKIADETCNIEILDYKVNDENFQGNIKNNQIAPKQSRLLNYKKFECNPSHYKFENHFKFPEVDCISTFMRVQPQQHQIESTGKSPSENELHLKNVIFTKNDSIDNNEIISTKNNDINKFTSSTSNLNITKSHIFDFSINKIQDCDKQTESASSLKSEKYNHSNQNINSINPNSNNNNSQSIRRARLKSISLDSDGARLVEDNLGVPVEELITITGNQTDLQQFHLPFTNDDEIINSTAIQNEETNCFVFPLNLNKQIENGTFGTDAKHHHNRNIDHHFIFVDEPFMLSLNNRVPNNYYEKLNVLTTSSPFPSSSENKLDKKKCKDLIEKSEKRLHKNQLQINIEGNQKSTNSSNIDIDDSHQLSSQTTNPTPKTPTLSQIKSKSVSLDSSEDFNYENFTFKNNHVSNSSNNFYCIPSSASTASSTIQNKCFNSSNKYNYSTIQEQKFQQSSTIMAYNDVDKTDRYNDDIVIEIDEKKYQQKLQNQQQNFKLINKKSTNIISPIKCNLLTVCDRNFLSVSNKSLSNCLSQTTISKTFDHSSCSSTTTSTSTATDRRSSFHSKLSSFNENPLDNNDVVGVDIDVDNDYLNHDNEDNELNNDDLFLNVIVSKTNSECTDDPTPSNPLKNNTYNNKPTLTATHNNNKENEVENESDKTKYCICILSLNSTTNRNNNTICSICNKILSTKNIRNWKSHGHQKIISTEENGDIDSSIDSIISTENQRHKQQKQLQQTRSMSVQYNTNGPFCNNVVFGSTLQLQKCTTLSLSNNNLKTLPEVMPLSDFTTTTSQSSQINLTDNEQNQKHSYQPNNVKMSIEKSSANLNNPKQHQNMNFTSRSSLLQRRGSNHSLTLNLNSTSTGSLGNLTKSLSISNYCLSNYNNSHNSNSNSQYGLSKSSYNLPFNHYIYNSSNYGKNCNSSNNISNSIASSNCGIKTNFSNPISGSNLLITGFNSANASSSSLFLKNSNFNNKSDYSIYSNYNETINAYSNQIGNTMSQQNCFTATPTSGCGTIIATTKSDSTKNLLQRRGSNTSLTLNIHGSNRGTSSCMNLNRFNSHSSLNINSTTKHSLNNQNPNLYHNIKYITSSSINLSALCGNNSRTALFPNSSKNNINMNSYKKAGLLERRNSNASLTLNINSIGLSNNLNPKSGINQSNVSNCNKELSVSNYNLRESAYSLNSISSNTENNIHYHHHHFHHHHHHHHHNRDEDKGQQSLENLSKQNYLTNYDNNLIDDNDDDHEVIVVVRDGDVLVDNNMKLKNNFNEYQYNLNPTVNAQLISQTVTSAARHRKFLSSDSLNNYSQCSKINQTHVRNISKTCFGSVSDLKQNNGCCQMLKKQNNISTNKVLNQKSFHQKINNTASQLYIGDGNLCSCTGVRNITTRPLSPQSTSEDFKIYLANIQLLQNATSSLNLQKLRKFSYIFENCIEQFDDLTKHQFTTAITTQPKNETNATAEQDNYENGESKKYNENLKSLEIIRSVSITETSVEKICKQSKSKIVTSQEDLIQNDSNIQFKNDFKTSIPHATIISTDDDSTSSGEILDITINLDIPDENEKKLLICKLHKEFWDLPTNYQEKPLVFGSQLKNRYRTVLPNEHSRVLLDQDNDLYTTEPYINANYIKGPDYSRNNYIAAQGPLSNTLYDHWLMIYQNIIKYKELIYNYPNSDQIIDSMNRGNKTSNEDLTKLFNYHQKVVMLTDFVESNRPKCCQYFPLNINDTVIITLNNDYIEDIKDDCIKFFEEYLNFDFMSEKAEKFNKGDIKAASYDSNINNDGEVIVEISDTNSNSKLYDNLNNQKKEKHQQQVLLNFTNKELDILNIPKVNFFIIKNSSELYKNGYTIRKLNCLYVRNCKNNKNHNDKTVKIIDKFHVYHYWYKEWPDHKIPTNIDVLLNMSIHILDADLSNEFLKHNHNINYDESEILSYNNYINFENQPLPIIHCSAGIGRTGCLIAILNGIRQMRKTANIFTIPENINLNNINKNYIKKNKNNINRNSRNSSNNNNNNKNDNDEKKVYKKYVNKVGSISINKVNTKNIFKHVLDINVDVLGIVCNLRLQRGGMVQNSEQYELIYRALCMYLKHLEN